MPWRPPYIDYMPLSRKQKLFIKNYLIHKNATKAAKAAGYSSKTAAKMGSENLHKPYIQKAIDAELKKQMDRAELKSDDVIAEIRKVAFANLSKAYKENGELMHPHEMPEDIQASLQSVETFEEFAGRGEDRIEVGLTKKIKLNDKIRALEMLGKHFKLFTDVVENTGKDGGPMVVLTIPANGSEADGSNKA